MPRAKKSTETKERPFSERQANPEWGGFLNLRISEEEKTAFERWFAGDGCPMWEMYEQAMIDGLKFSHAWDEDNQCYIASFTGTLIPGQQTRYATSARAGTYVESIALLCYKHFVLADGDWSNYLPKTGKFMSWG